MRSIPLLAATTVIALGAWACGDGGTDVGNPPVAAFTQVCTDLTCTFDDQSTGSITSWNWTFGDLNSGANNTATGPTPTHAFSGPGTYDVTLTVTDGSGATDAQTNAVTVTGGTGNTPPTASFIAPLCTVGAACAFTDGSSDPDGTVSAWNWNFGDNGTAVDQHPTHTYLTAGTFTVTLIVNDDDGAASQPFTQTVTVSPATATQCTAALVDVDCVLSITSPSKITVTLTDRSCELNSRVTVRPPYAQTVFFNVCFLPTIGESHTLKDANGLDLTFAADTQVVLRFTRGEPGVGDPPAGVPAANMTGTFPNWTINIEDGGNQGGPGEPDFNDVILSVTATP